MSGAEDASPPEEDVSLAGEVNVKRHKRRVWLVKVPPFIAEAWRGGEPSETLGSLRIEMAANDPTWTVGMALEGPSARGLPRDFVLHTTPAPPACIFSEDEEGRINVEGTVEYKCEVQPVLNAEYRQLLRARTDEQHSRRAQRQIQLLDDSRTFLTPRPRHRDIIRPRKRPDVPVEVEKEKRARIEKADLIDLLMKLFEKEPYWNLRDLTERTDQPQVWLKEVLSGVCVYHKRGEHKTMWELKPEYKVGGNPERLKEENG